MVPPEPEPSVPPEPEPLVPPEPEPSVPPEPDPLVPPEPDPLVPPEPEPSASSEPDPLVPPEPDPLVPPEPLVPPVPKHSSSSGSPAPSGPSVTVRTCPAAISESTSTFIPSRSISSKESGPSSDHSVKFAASTRPFVESAWVPNCTAASNRPGTELPSSRVLTASTED